MLELVSAIKNISNCSSTFHRQPQHKQPTRPQQKRPVVPRYEGFQHKVHDEPTYRRPTPFTPQTFPSEPQTPEPYKPKIYKPFLAKPSARPVRLDTSPVQRNFQHQFNEDTEFDFEEEMKKFDFDNQRALQEPRENYDEDRAKYSKQDVSVSTLKVESRENPFDDVSSNSRQNLKTIFDQNPLFADAEFQQSFEPERFSFAEIEKQSGDNKKKFNPPDITEKFKSPLKESQSYPFLQSSGKEKTNIKQRKVKPFINYKTLVQKPKETKKRRTETQPSNVPTFSNFETFQEIPKIGASPSPPAPQASATVSPAKQSSYEKLPTFSHFKTKPSFSSFKAKPTKLSSKPRKPSKPTTTYSPSLKTFDELPTFTNFKTINSSPKTSLSNSQKPSEPTSKPFPSFINFKPKSEPAAQPQTQARTAYKTYEATTVKSSEPPSTEQPTTTQKPYNYQKKNFREPLKQVVKNSGEHQIIRIKTKQDGRPRPQPKQLDLPQSGFKPIAGPRSRPQSQPGRLEIQEVNRRQGVYQPSDVIFDNDQPLLTLDTVRPFRARSTPDSFAIDVKASFNPKPKQENKRPQRLQKRLMRLPNSKFSHLLHRRPVKTVKSNKVAVAQ